MELWAADETRLLIEGARALVALLTDNATLVGAQRRAIHIADAVDPEDRLVRWLAEVLYLGSVEGFLVTDAAIELSEGGVQGSVLGVPDAHDQLRLEIKAVTYHDLTLERGPTQVRARVVFDV